MVSLCALRADGQLYGIETCAVREVVQNLHPQPIPLAPAAIAGLAVYRGDVLTIVSLRSLLGLNKEFAGGRIVVMDDDSGEEPFGLAVDTVEDVLMIRESTLEPNPSTLDMQSARFFAGAYSTPYGLIVSLDVKTLAPSRVVDDAGGEKRGYGW
ncbi:MAG: hypothetical protein NVSMB62_12590 [Acidobacteriaceae bacterium]